MKIYKSLYVMAVMIMFAEAIAVNASAYIDVSATSYIIQIVVGIVVAVGAVAGVVISRIKKKAKDKFGIDLEHKETEEEVVVYDNNETAEDKENVSEASEDNEQSE